MVAIRKHRWFRFSLRTLLALMAVAAVLMGQLLPNDKRDIQGTWYGTGSNARFTLTFDDDALLGKVGTNPIVKPTIAAFHLVPEQRHIDILRDDGVQQGLYKIDGSTLILMLAQVGQPRPTSLDDPPFVPQTVGAKKGTKAQRPPTLPRQTRYVFSRQPPL